MKRPLRARLRRSDGFGLVELLIALSVLLVGVLGIFAMFESGLRSVSRAGERTTAAALASSQMERFRAIGWESIGLDETAVVTAAAPYATDSAYRPATGRVPVVACGVSPCTSAVPVRATSGADGRNYRVDTYVAWQTVAAGRDVKVVTIVVRDALDPGRTITRLASAFDGQLPGEDAVAPIPSSNTPPAVVTPPAQTTNRGSSASLQITASDADGDLITYSSSSLPAGLEIDITSGLISGTPTVAGTFTPRIDVFDGEATTSVSFTWTVTGPAPPTNVALGKPAIQSSTVSGRVASRAVDGSLLGDSASRAQTSNTTRPWWEVDLGSVQALGSMRIVGGGGCCASGSPSLLVLASDTPFLSTSMDVNSALADFRTTISATAYADVSFASLVSARYVRLYLAGTGQLSLAEVRVYTPGTVSSGD